VLRRKDTWSLFCPLQPAFRGTAAGTKRGCATEFGRHLLLPIRRPVGPSSLKRQAYGIQFPLGERRVDPHKPVARGFQRPGMQNCLGVRIAPLAPPCAAPSPLLGGLNQTRPQRISLHISAGREEVLVRLNGERFVRALVKVPGPCRAAMGMPPLGMGDREPPEELGHLPIAGWPEDHVPMVGHDTVGEQVDRGSPTGLFKDSLEGRIVAGMIEERERRHGTVHRVVNHAADISTGSSWHGRDSIGRAPSLQHKKTPGVFVC